MARSCFDYSPSLDVGRIALEKYLGHVTAERNMLARRLHETAAERDVLKEQVQRLKKEVVRLKAKLEDAQRTAKRQAAPFARPRRSGDGRGSRCTKITISEGEKVEVELLVAGGQRGEPEAGVKSVQEESSGRSTSARTVHFLDDS